MTFSLLLFNGSVHNVRKIWKKNGDDEMNLVVWAGPTYSLIACNLDVAVAN